MRGAPRPDPRRIEAAAARSRAARKAPPRPRGAYPPHLHRSGPAAAASLCAGPWAGPGRAAPRQRSAPWGNAAGSGGKAEGQGRGPAPRGTAAAEASQTERPSLPLPLPAAAGARRRAPPHKPLRRGREGNRAVPTGGRRCPETSRCSPPGRTTARPRPALSRPSPAGAASAVAPGVSALPAQPPRPDPAGSHPPLPRVAKGRPAPRVS